MAPTVRPAIAGDAAAIARVRIEAWRATYRGLIPDAYLDSMDLETSIDLWNRVLTSGSSATSVFVADSGGEVIGFAAGNLLAEPRHGLNAELTAVYLRREFQRAGLGHKLICAVAHAQQALGASGLIVWVLSGNRNARAFFEHLGAALLVEQPFEWDGMPLTEAGYGFSAIGALADACNVRAGPDGSTMH